MWDDASTDGSLEAMERWALRLCARPMWTCKVGGSPPDAAQQSLSLPRETCADTSRAEAGRRHDVPLPLLSCAGTHTL